MSTAKKANTAITVLSLLIIEVLAFVGFSLGNSFVFYGVLGAASFILVLFLTSVQFKNEWLTSLATFLIPLFIFGLLTIVSGFSGYFDLTTNLFVPISFICFAGLGYCLNQFKEFKLKHAFLAIYGSLSLLTLISLIYNMVQFVPFYTIIYRNSYLIYDGMPTNAPIGETAYLLMGFSFVAVSVEFFSLFPTLLATSTIALFFLKPKKDKILFAIYAVFASIGICTLVVMPTIMTLISTVGIGFISLIIIMHSKKLLDNKFIKILGIAFLSIFAALFLFALFNANMTFSFIESNPLLDKVFNSNRLALGYNFILGNVFKQEYLLGYHFEGFKEHGTTLYGFSNCWFFDNFIYSGVFGFIAFIVAIYFGAKSVIKYINKAGHQNYEKALILGFVLSFFVFIFITYDPQPYINYENYIPYYMNGPFLLVIFLVGYTLNNKEKVEEAVKENIPSEESVSIESITIKEGE